MSDNYDGPQMAAKILRQQKEIERLRALRALLAEAVRDQDQILNERDHAEGMADKLAAAVAALLGVEIGEHSSANCPWTEALKAFEERAADSAGTNS